MTLDIHNLIADLKSKGKPFAVATVVRTVSVTAAKAGAKAVIDSEGQIKEGWIGGGCAKGAVVKAAKHAIEHGEPTLVSLLPEELIKDVPDEEGIRLAKNMCPSKGTMDIFVEPVLPPSKLVILGNSPVAIALADIASRFGFASERMSEFETSLPISIGDGLRFIVVSTQGSGDLKALEAALTSDCDYVAFVGSKKKTASLRKKLEDKGIAPSVFTKLKAPAGLDIGAITPDEIALSIVAEMIKTQRKGQRGN